ncbi:hypothetical protein BK278_09525 [Escherichia coli]|nr:hypothetical protein BK278_09525 [Escherichia coli]OJM72234.1 hypothetical protein BK287_20300 [Escherichia coli]
MRDDFCAFILTHGRPDKVLTYRTLRRAGYTGKIFIVVDDEDKTRNQYMAEFGEQVLVFSKADIASRFDEADNFCDRRSIFYARNACFDLAKLVGCKYFIQLDDDYHEFQFRVDRNYDQAYFPIRKLDAILSEMLAYYESIPALSIAMSQGGDFLGDNGGHASWVKRKAMNSFICSVDRPFSFMGRINEDVNTYTNLGRCGELFMTIGAVQLGQKQTQKNSGGMTELYLDSGIAPPDIPAGFVAVFNSDEASWHLVEDHRGKTVYDVASGDELFISELGPLPENVTWLSPEGEFQKWNGTAWVKDTEAEKLFRIREAEETKNNLMQVASEHIAPLQDAADLEIATEEEISLLEAWKKYRVLLNRVDTSTSQDIEWPALP